MATVEHLDVEHLGTAALRSGLGHVRASPADNGVVELIVRRPAVDEREVLAVAALDVAAGLAGDTWRARGSTRTADRSANPAMQLTVMNSRAALLVAQEPDRRKRVYFNNGRVCAFKHVGDTSRGSAGCEPFRTGLTAFLRSVPWEKEKKFLAGIQ